MNKAIRNGLLWLGAFTAYRLYKLYELGESVIYKPVGVSFRRGATLNDFVIRVKIEVLNVQKTIVKMRGIDGELIVKGQTVGTFYAGAFEIRPGLNYLFMDFKVDPKAVGAELIQAIIAKKTPVLYVRMNQHLPFFSVTDTFAVNPELTSQETVFVK
jgi:hypothetical protein